MQKHKTLVGQKLKINKNAFGCPPKKDLFQEHSLTLVWTYRTVQPAVLPEITKSEERK